MSESMTGWDIFFIVLSCILALCLIVTLVLPLFNGLNPFKIMVGNISDYNFAEATEFRNSNILNGLLGVEDPHIYPISNNQEDIYENDDEKKLFKHFNDYNMFVESYNQPRFSDFGIEVYGPWGLELTLPSQESHPKLEYEFDLLSGNSLGGHLIPYYSTEIDGTTYISAIDLSASAISLEKFDGEAYTTVASISGATWETVFEQNNGVAVIRRPDGGLIFDSGEYKLTLSFKQVLLYLSNGFMDYKVMEPKMELYYFNVNEHDCSNGIIIANNAECNTDVQLNVINSEKTVCYAPRTKINVGDNLQLGVSLSESIFRELLINDLGKMGATIHVEIYRFDAIDDEYVLLDNHKVMDAYSVALNKTILCEGEDYQSGRYRIVVIYDSWLERIEQDYEYYFVFE